MYRWTSRGNTFTAPFTLPVDLPPANRRVIYFPGSTIGNLEVADAVGLLQSMTRVAGPEGGLLIGIDLKKSPEILEAAYNDKQGVTAAFNLNLIQRVNRELQGTFQLDRFRHYAPYNPRDGRIEMHLVSHQDQAVAVGQESFEFAAGESICTEYSHKYSVDEFSRLALRGGWSLIHNWLDDQNLFAVLYLEVKAG
jgi:dimethylhistidine N-methyltransferase